VEFSLDKALEPGMYDGRELGLIVAFYRTALARTDALLPIRFV
jgi:hypothetical protein